MYLGPKTYYVKLRKIPIYNKNKYHTDFYQKTKYHLQLKYHKIQTFKNWAGMHSRLCLPTFRLTWMYTWAMSTRI